jgi:hypothetical protein
MERSLRITTHKKNFGNLEVRLYVPRVRSGWHRMGTLSLSGVAWRTIVKPLLHAGAERTGVRLTVEDGVVPEPASKDELGGSDHDAAC